MKLYIIILDEVYNDQVLQHKPIVRLSKEEARKELNELYTAGCCAYTDWVTEKSDDSFSLYSDGEWSESHFDAEIHEVEVEGIEEVI